jgi:hypothetical protein
MASVDTNWQYCGMQVVRLENDLVCMDVLPELGAKIYSFIHRPSGCDLLWHNPHLLPERQAYGACFDDNWSGGWDELLPNDLPRPAPGGDMLPDHGEFWAQAAQWEIVERGLGACAARFTQFGRVLPSRFEKTVQLYDGESFARIHYSFANLGQQPLPYLWNIHPPMAVGPASWLDVPAVRGLTDPWRETHFKGGAGFDWPFVSAHGGEKVDLRRMPAAQEGYADMHYLPDVKEGWYAVTDQDTRVGFALSFPTAIFPHLWLFRALGGWRGLYTLILEASTGYPYDLQAAAQAGTCGWLQPGQTLEADVLAIAYAGMRTVQKVTPDGQVIPGEIK